MWLGFKWWLVLKRSQALALREAGSESHDPKQVAHIDVIAAERLDDRHLAALIGHLGSNLEGCAFRIALVDVARLAQVVACEAVWKKGAF